MTLDTTILAPAAVLALWSLIILMWTALTRFPALAKLGMNIKSAPPGGRGVNLDGVLPDSVQWKSHNYTHLMEQPTLFYAVVVILTLVGQSGGLHTQLAWGYVGIRIVHSIWQATVNTIPIRFSLFILSTLCLLALSVHAVIATLGH
ncbi:MAG: MAPEG family protein [Pseudomonadota bacterium]